MSNTKKYGPIKEKAWRVDLDRISEGYAFCDNIIYSHSRNIAKRKLLSSYYNDLCLSDYDKTEVTYLNIPILRAKEYDKHEYKGEILSIPEIKDAKVKEERLSEFKRIIDDKSITHCYISKHGSYYADNHCGYVGSKTRAGIYDKEDAVSCGESCSDLFIIPIETEDHNKMVNEEILKLQKRLI